MGRERSRDRTGAGPTPPQWRGHTLAWRDVMARSPLALVILDPETFSIRDASTAFHEMTGLPREKLLHRPLPDLLPAPGAEKLLSVLSATRESGSARRAPNVPYLHPEHGLVSWDCVVWPLADAEDGGEALSVQVSLVTDGAAEQNHLSQIVEQIRDANEQLLIAGIRQLELAELSRQHARRIDDVLASQAAGVLVLDAAGDVLVINGPALRMLGLPDEAAPDLAARIRTLELRRADGSEVPAADHPVERLLRGEPFSDLELRVPNGNGDEARFAFNGSAIGDSRADGMSLGILVFYDVTAKRRLDDLRADYISLIAHDLRSPLNAILGYAELLRLLESRALGEGSSWIDRIEHSAHQMGSMIDDLVESTRLESGILTIQRRPTALRTVILEALEHLPTPEDRERVRLEAPPEPVAVPVDAERIERLVTNLLSNALKYSPPDAPVVVRLQAHEKEIVLSVSDRGPGLAPESIPHLFQRFYRVDPGSRIEGMGLGLYIARLIVEAHGGRIWAESEPGQGSTFSVALPVA